MTITIDKILKVEDLSSLSTDLLIIAYKNGFKVEELPVHTNVETKIEKIDTYKYWKPLSDIEIQEIRNTLSLDIKTDIKTDTKQTTIDNLEKSSVLSLSLGIDNPTTCPSEVIQNSQHIVTIQALGGIPPYTFTMFSDNYIPWKDSNGTPWKYITNSTNPISLYNTFTVPPGTHSFIARVIDSSPTPQIEENSFIIKVLACSLPSSNLTVS